EPARVAIFPDSFLFTSLLERTSYMGNPIDDAFAAGDDAAAQAKHAKDEQERQGKIYDSQVEALVRSYVEAVQRKAEEYNAHPRTTNKAAVMPGGTQLTIRRASRQPYSSCADGRC